MQFITFFHYSVHTNQDGTEENIFYFKKTNLIKSVLFMYYLWTLVALVELNKILIKKLEFSKVITAMIE